MDEVTPPGLCQCGCGQQTGIAPRNEPRHGYVKGQPRRFIKGHSSRGANHYNWRGDEGSYRTIHTWLRKHFPKTGICDECGVEAKTDYALIKGRSYSRNREDYRELCRRCHVFYDEVGYCRYWRERGLAVEMPDGGPPACKCGCGEPVGWYRGKKRWYFYAPGHYQNPVFPREKPVVSLLQLKLRFPSARPQRPRQRNRKRMHGPMACGHCGREFTPKRSDTQFCSKACKAAARRASGVDDVQRTCHVCGGPFMISRYSKIGHCSQSCGTTCWHAGNCPG